MNYLVIDVGGSAIKYAVCDDDLNLTCKSSQPLGHKSTSQQYYEIISDIYQSINVPVKGVAISMPGKINPQTGFCQVSSVLLDKDLPIADDLTALLNVPVTVINDGYSAGMAELGYGNLKDVDNGAVIVLGTGIGGALIINRKLYTGNGNCAGNMSFLHSDYHEPYDFGNTFAMLNGIKGLKQAVAETSGISDVDGLKAFQMIKEGNEDVRKGVELFCDRLVYQIFNIQHLLDLDRVLIGGGISNEPTFIDYVREAYKRLTDNNRVNPRAPEIMNCRYNSDANLLGALYNWKQHY